MKVYINKKEMDIDRNDTISKLVERMHFSSRGIAIAVNQQIIPKSRWNYFQLNEKDTILLIKATQGG
jgi:sulfur carrier protein